MGWSTSSLEALLARGLDGEACRLMLRMFSTQFHLLAGEWQLRDTGLPLAVYPTYKADKHLFSCVRSYVENSLIIYTVRQKSDREHSVTILCSERDRTHDEGRAESAVFMDARMGYTLVGCHRASKRGSIP